MPIPRQTNDALRKARHRMGFEVAKEQAEGMGREYILEAQRMAQNLVDRNYTAGKRLSAAYPEGKVEGFRQALQGKEG